MIRVWVNQRNTYNSVHVAEEGVLDRIVVVLDGVHEVQDHSVDPLFLGAEGITHHGNGSDEEQEDRRSMQHATLPV
jgi:hypothetical protein